jgi:hypothetical protein
LNTFQFYEASGNPPLITYADEEEEKAVSEAELKGLILPWKTYCPSLREVQLVAGYLWRRASSEETWFQRSTPAEDVEDNWRESVF